MSNTQNKKLYISVLSVFSALSVVLLHMSSFWSFSAPATKRWVFSNFIESAFYFAVPVFFMISGATLIDYRKRYTTKDFFKKRLLKTAIPFLFWSVFGLFYIVLLNGSLPDGFSAASFINSIINCGYTGIYWFFPAIFSVYLAIPVFASIPENMRQKIFGYIIIGAFIFNSFLPFLFSFTFGKLKYNTALNMPMGAGYLIFVLIGYYIDNYEIKKKFRCISYILGIISLCLHFFGTWYLSNQKGYIYSLFKGYTNTACILYSVAIFIFFKYFNFEILPSWLIKILTYFKGQTFGVYLIHIYIIQWIPTVVTWDFRGYFYLYRTFGALLIFILCSFITKLLQKIPIVKYIIP